MDARTDANHPSDKMPLVWPEREVGSTNLGRDINASDRRQPGNIRLRRRARFNNFRQENRDAHAPQYANNPGSSPNIR